MLGLDTHLIDSACLLCLSSTSQQSLAIQHHHGCVELSVQKYGDPLLQQQTLKSDLVYENGEEDLDLKLLMLVLMLVN